MLTHLLTSCRTGWTRTRLRQGSNNDLWSIETVRTSGVGSGDNRRCRTPAPLQCQHRRLCFPQQRRAVPNKGVTCMDKNLSAEASSSWHLPAHVFARGLCCFWHDRGKTGSQHEMMLRMIRLHKPLQAYSTNTSLSRTALDGVAINDFTCLLSMVDDSQEAAGRGGDAAPVPKISRMEKIRRQRSLLVVQPDAGAGAEQDLSRSTAAEQEFEDCMEMPPVANSHDFDLLNAWKSYATDGVDAKTGKVITPARLPHIGLLARLHLGIDATSCQAERNFSAFSALLGDLQINLGRRKVEMMMLRKLNQQLIPGLADVVQRVADPKGATAAGNVVSPS